MGYIRFDYETLGSTGNIATDTSTVYSSNGMLITNGEYAASITLRYTDPNTQQETVMLYTYFASASANDPASPPTTIDWANYSFYKDMDFIAAVQASCSDNVPIITWDSASFLTDTYFAPDDYTASNAFGSLSYNENVIMESAALSDLLASIQSEVIDVAQGAGYAPGTISDLPLSEDFTPSILSICTLDGVPFDCCAA